MSGMTKELVLIVILFIPNSFVYFYRACNIDNRTHSFVLLDCIVGLLAKNLQQVRIVPTG